MIHESWGKVLAKVGALGAIALYLVYLLGGDIKGSVSNTESMLSAHIEATRLLTGSTAKIADSLQVLVNVQLQDCINSAGPNAAKRRACFDALYRTPER